MYFFNYSFEGSSEVRHVSNKNNRISGEDICKLIIVDLFGNTAPPCELEVADQWIDAGKTVIVKRIYAKKFHEETKQKPELKPIKRVRRWRSRSPVRRRWRSRSPVNNYNIVYTNIRW